MTAVTASPGIPSLGIGIRFPLTAAEAIAIKNVIGI
jgi:hypothetical protein